MMVGPPYLPPAGPVGFPGEERPKAPEKAVAPSAATPWCFGLERGYCGARAEKAKWLGATVNPRAVCETALGLLCLVTGFAVTVTALGVGLAAVAFSAADSPAGRTAARMGRRP